MGVEQASSQQRLTSGAGGLLLLQGGYCLARFGELFLCRYKELYDFKATAHDFPWLASGGGGPTMLIYYNAIITKQGLYSTFCAGTWVTMTQPFSRKQEQPVLEQGLCGVSSTSFILALGHLQSFLPPDPLLPQFKEKGRDCQLLACKTRSSCPSGLGVHRCGSCQYLPLSGLLALWWLVCRWSQASSQPAP